MKVHSFPRIFAVKVDTFNVFSFASTFDFTDYTDEDHDLLTKKYCETLARKLSGLLDTLPNGCKEFDSVKRMIDRHDSERHDDAIAFAGMHTGEALAASKLFRFSFSLWCFTSSSFIHRKKCSLV